MTKVSILIVSHAKDFEWLRYCLQSIERFATGFHEVCVFLPAHESWIGASQIAAAYNGSIPLRIAVEDQWPDKPFMFHEWLIINADNLCPDADFICHIDSDCVFHHPVTPEEYFVEGKPVLLFADYNWICKRFNNPNFMHWKTATVLAIGGNPIYETMRRHPAVHPLKTYRKTREVIQSHTGMEASAYIRRQRDTFPSTFAEFPILGEVARRYFLNEYRWINQETEPCPADKLWQFWSHAAPELEQDTWIDGSYVTVNPKAHIEARLARNPNQRAFERDPLLEAEFKRLIQKHHANAVIETGTEYGGTANKMAEWVPVVITMDIDKKFNDWDLSPNVHFYLGDSRKNLPHVIGLVIEPVFIFLDAHSSNDADECPLRGELEIVLASGMKPVIAIHDCIVPGREEEFAYDTYRAQPISFAMVEDLIKAIYKNGFDLHYNARGETKKPGCLFIEPRL